MPEPVSPEQNYFVSREKNIIKDAIRDQSDLKGKLGRAQAVLAVGAFDDKENFLQESVVIERYDSWKLGQQSEEEKQISRMLGVAGKFAAASDEAMGEIDTLDPKVIEKFNSLGFSDTFLLGRTVLHFDKSSIMAFVMPNRPYREQHGESIATDIAGNMLPKLDYYLNPHKIQNKLAS